MANERIRQAALESGVKMWQIAARWVCNDSNFSRKLRREFSPADTSRALAIIEDIKKEAENKKPTMTYKDDFFEKFPDAAKNSDGYPMPYVWEVYKIERELTAMVDRFEEWDKPLGYWEE